MKDLMTAYLASGWFTEEQEDARQDMIAALKGAGIESYSPKEDAMYVKGKTESVDIFLDNITQIENCAFVLASTSGKDMGTLFECGLAYAHSIPIVYYWKGGGGKFNIMLAESATAVITDFKELIEYLTRCKLEKKVILEDYTGGVE